ncbi:MAG: Telomeric repeat-binding factor 2 [Methanomethylovorans sp. PtaU1.Bin093]|nr:MAG: Telomeric repeat-binding factor 2 [Methanomethylovorans sp. PtaU1.Bin093]
MDKSLKIVLPIFIVFAIAVAFGGCVESMSSSTEDADQSTSGQVETPTTETQQPTAVESTSTKTKTTVFKIGESFGNEAILMTVNGVRTANYIDEKNNQYETATAPSGEEYIIVDVTIENIGNEMQYFASSVNFNVYDTEGYSYPSDFIAELALKKSFDGSNIAPGSTRRGEIPFLVPTGKTGLQLQFTGASQYAIIALE